MTHRPEALLERQVLRVLGADRDLALFRNECGEGHHVRASHRILSMLRSLGLYAEAREAEEIFSTSRVHFGLHNGSADLIGVLGGEAGGGRFVSFELKSDRGELSEDQVRWLARMRELGALAEVVRSPGQAALLIERARRGQI